MSIFRTILNNIFRRNHDAAPNEALRTDPSLTPIDLFELPSTTALARTIRPAPPSHLQTDAAANIQQSASGRPYLILGTIDEVRNVAQTPPPRGTTIILTGELVILSDAENDNIEHYHRQTDRIVKPLRTLTTRGHSFTLKVWLHEEVVALKHAYPRHKYSFAIDQYLHYGRTQNTSLHLITGHSGITETIFQIFTFDNGALTGLTEKILPATNHPRFHAEYAGLLNTYRRNGHTATVVHPLPDPETDQVAYLDARVYDKPIKYFIVDQNAAPSILVRYGLSIALAILIAALYIIAIALPYEEYNQATNAFQRVAASIPKNDLAFGSDQLKTMQERQRFLTEARPQTNSIPLMRDITAALSMGGIIIKSIALNRVKPQPSTPDVAIAIDMKRSATDSVFEQAQPILNRLASRLGMDVHLAHSGYQERTTADGRFVSYNLEANFKGVAQ